jgi:mono/diheme cytochrome c family protein
MIAVIGVAALAAAAAAYAADEAPSGERLYANHCAACHGSTGEGDGPVAAVMQATVPNLRTLAQRSRGAFPADAVAAYVDGRDVKVAHGSRQMPIWGDVFSETAPAAGEDAVRERITALVAFIAELQYR